QRSRRPRQKLTEIQHQNPLKRFHPVLPPPHYVLPLLPPAPPCTSKPHPHNFCNMHRHIAAAHHITFQRRTASTQHRIHPAPHLPTAATSTSRITAPLVSW